MAVTGVNNPPIDGARFVYASAGVATFTGLSVEHATPFNGPATYDVWSPDIADTSFLRRREWTGHTIRSVCSPIRTPPTPASSPVMLFPWACRPSITLLKSRFQLQWQRDDHAWLIIQRVRISAERSPWRPPTAWRGSPTSRSTSPASLHAPRSPATDWPRRPPCPSMSRPRRLIGRRELGDFRAPPRSRRQATACACCRQAGTPTCPGWASNRVQITLARLRR